MMPLSPLFQTVFTEKPNETVNNTLCHYCSIVLLFYLMMLTKTLVQDSSGLIMLNFDFLISVQLFIFHGSKLQDSKGSHD